MSNHPDSRDAVTRRTRSSCSLVMLCIVLSGTMASCGRSGKQPSGAATTQEVDAVLKVVELPTLPPTVTSVQCWNGGLFAKYLNIKFRALPEEAVDYFKRTGAEGYFEFQEQNGKYFIAATHSLSGSPVTRQKPPLFELELKRGMALKPWFESVYNIRHGWYWDKPDIAGYQLYYDLNTQQFYIYWWYS